MKIVHETFRRAYEEAAQLIRANPTPSPARVTFLADHIEFGLNMLHHHHEGEDAILYPLLVERVPDHATRTEQIDHEHQVVKQSIDSALTACSKWRTAPSDESAEKLASSLDNLNSDLVPHLDNEEREIVPLAAVTVTQEEWDSLAKHGIAAIPGNKKLIAFGMILEPLNPADRAYMLSNLPPPVKVLYRVLGQRAWNRYATILRSGK
ncbi:MAG: hemerythrin domain-containing protein [Acidimicrobiales bacterium]